MQGFDLGPKSIQISRDNAQPISFVDDPLIDIEELAKDNQKLSEKNLVLSDRLLDLEQRDSSYPFDDGPPVSKHKFGNVLKALADRPVLTIADMEDFAGRGGIVYLKLAQSNIRFEVNIGYAKLVGLSFSSELLMLADIVSGEINRDRFSAPTD